MSEKSFPTFKQMLYKICNQCSSRVTKSSQESEFSLEKKKDWTLSFVKEIKLLKF